MAWWYRPENSLSIVVVIVRACILRGTECWIEEADEGSKSRWIESYKVSEIEAEV